MRQGWNPNTIELRFTASTLEKERQVLEQAGEILYSYLCQLVGTSSTETTVTVSSQTKGARTDG